MAGKPYKLEIDFFGLSFSKELEKLEDVLGVTLSLGPFVKVGIRDLRPQATYHATVGIHQQVPGDPQPLFRIPLDGADGSLSLVPIAMEVFGWRHVTINGHRATANIGSRDASSGSGIPPAVPGYDDRRNVLLRLPDQATNNGANGHPVPARITAPVSPDSGLGSSSSDSSDGVPEANNLGYARPAFQRQMARRGRMRSSTSSDNDKRPRHE